MAAPSPNPEPRRTLRGELDDFRASGKRHTLKQAVGIVVPLAVELSQLHQSGESFYVHPSSIQQDLDGDWHLVPHLAGSPPEDPRDKACMAPEERAGHAAGNARSSVFAIGAILYELCTGETVGPGMRRPSDVVGTLGPDFDQILAKALVSDPAHRPDDLKALAQAIHHMSPAGSLPPPPADESHLDHDVGFDVDISLSLVPPPPAGGISPYDIAVREAPKRVSGLDQATGELTELKQRLESDPRPRYVVIKDGMDHGPFNAVEMLQQIASHTFEEQDLLRDTLTEDEKLIVAWPEFAPFAEHARRHRDIAAEKVAIHKTVEEEKKSTRGKAILGLTAVGVVLAAGAIWFLTQAGIRKDTVVVQGQEFTSVDDVGDLGGGKKGGGKGGRRVIGTQGGLPILAGGMSCEAAQAAYVEEIKMGGSGQADITGAQYGAVLNSGSYLNGCGLASNAGVDVCVAVQNGRAVGVTVRVSPSNPGVSSCIAGHIRGMSFPSHPKLDVTRTHFAGQ